MLGTTLPAYTDFQALLAEIDPDGVIVCTQDRTHAGYIVQALAAGKRVYCEKPLCTSAEQCREILAAAARCKGQVFVTHNMRYGPAEQRIKALVDAGKIGRLLSLEFNEHLDRSHGADSFRRWHRYQENSGGLLIHKASHHFDAMNWLAASRPEVLTALGGLLFYGRNGRLRGERCLDCAHAAEGRCALRRLRLRARVPLFGAADLHGAGEERADGLAGECGGGGWR
jgi:predicted dehydrogenase